MTRLMALDVGEARIGVAVCDAREILASPYTTLHVTRDETQTFAAIQRLIAETEAEGLVVGLPISMDGEIHGQGKWVQEFVERLKPSLSLPITFWDERLSTVEARRLLNQDDAWGEDIGRTRQRRRRSSKRRNAQEIDAYAAAVILQDYLDSRGRNVEGTT